MLIIRKFLIALCALLLSCIANADDLVLWMCHDDNLVMFLVIDPDDGQFTIFNSAGVYMGANTFEVMIDKGKSFYQSKVDYDTENGIKKTMLIVGDMNMTNHTLFLAMQDNAEIEAGKISPVLIMRCN